MTTEELKPILEKTITDLLSEKMQGVEKDLGVIVEEKFKETVKDLNLDKTNFKHGIFPVVGGEDEKAQKELRMKAFMRHVLRKDATNFVKDFYPEIKDLSGAVDSDGGFLVPVEFMAEIQRIAEEFGLIRKYGRVIPMSGDKLELPSNNSSVTTTWQGVQGSNIGGSKSSPKFGLVTLNTDTLAGITVTTNQFLADAKINIMDFVMELFAEVFAGEEDYQGFRGTGSPFVGVLNKSGVGIVNQASGDTAFTDVSLDYLRDMMTKVKSSALSGSAFIMHRELWGEIQKIKENNQHVVTFQNPIAPMTDYLNRPPLTPVGTVWQAPVLLSDKMPALAETAVSTPYIIFGSLKRGLFLGDREQTTVKLSEEGTVGGESLLERIKSAIRVTERVAVTVALPEAFSVLKTSAS